VANLILENDGLQVETSMYIDSGADVTMIPLRFGRALGLKQTSSDTILELRGISGSGIPYLLKEIVITLNGEKLRARIAWAFVEEVPLLLGRMDVFNHFQIIFDERKGWVDFKKHTSKQRHTTKN
jgi:predicted aspartyl protease